MKSPTTLATGAFAAAFLCVILANTVMAQDPVKVEPTKFKVLLDNDRVRVLDVWLKPGEKVAMHSHPAHFIYYLTDFKLKTTLPAGKTTETEGKAGDVRWSEAVTHANENMGTADGHALVVELKGPSQKQKK